MKEGLFTSILGVLGGVAVWLFGGWDAILITLAIFVALDYLTGTIKAAIKKELNSSTGFVGLLRKGCILLVVVVASKLDALLGQAVFRSIACMFYIANEGISILENVSEVGVPLPPVILKALQKMKASAEDKEPAIQDTSKDEVFKPPNANS